MLLKVVVILLAVLRHRTKGMPLQSSADNLDEFFTQYIIGGTEAPENYTPHMAGLVVGYDFLMIVCGASIVTKKHIISAAHCIDIFIDPNGKLLYTFHGVVGTNNWNSGGLPVYFKDFHIHPKWDYATIKNDIGILTLKNALKFNEKVNPIPLGFDYVGGGVSSYVVGWGFTRPNFIPYRLHYLNVTTIGSKDCIHGIKKVAAKLGWSAPDVNPEVEICTFHSLNHGNCYGDSGGALVSRKTHELTGIVSWAIPCALGAPDVYVRISGFKEFIKHVLQL